MILFLLLFLLASFLVQRFFFSLASSMRWLNQTKSAERLSESLIKGAGRHTEIWSMSIWFNRYGKTPPWLDGSKVVRKFLVVAWPSSTLRALSVKKRLLMVSEASFSDCEILTSIPLPSPSTWTFCWLLVQALSFLLVVWTWDCTLSRSRPSPLAKFGLAWASSSLHLNTFGHFLQ